MLCSFGFHYHVAHCMYVQYILLQFSVSVHVKTSEHVITFHIKDSEVTLTTVLKHMIYY